VSAARVSVFVDNRVGRAGVPTRRSFETWIAASIGTRRRAAAEVNIALLDRRAARALNRDFRGRDYATNVLSFPCEPLPGVKSALLGDLAICPAVVAREAREQRKHVRDHFAHLTVHGVLHLLGFDHEDDRDAEKMETLERKVLATLGIADPYA
jgi:probable rRNA maturation factor